MVRGVKNSLRRLWVTRVTFEVIRRKAQVAIANKQQILIHFQRPRTKNLH